MEQVINDMFQARLPDGLTKRAQRMAIDLNVQPYDGTPSPKETPYSYRSEAEPAPVPFMRTPHAL